MSAIQMVCDDCGAIYMAGVVGTTPWPPHRCPVRAMREAIAAMRSRMINDERLGEPYDEDMARAIAACCRALGDEKAASGWYRPAGAAPANPTGPEEEKS